MRRPPELPNPTSEDERGTRKDRRRGQRRGGGGVQIGAEEEGSAKSAPGRRRRGRSGLSWVRRRCWSSTWVRRRCWSSTGRRSEVGAREGRARPTWERREGEEGEGWRRVREAGEGGSRAREEVRTAATDGCEGASDGGDARRGSPQRISSQCRAQPVDIRWDDFWPPDVSLDIGCEYHGSISTTSKHPETRYSG